MNIRHFLFTILSAVAEAERDRIRERIGTVKADQRARGVTLAGACPTASVLPPMANLNRSPNSRRSLRAWSHYGRPASRCGRLASLDEHLSVDAISRICRDATAATDHSGAPAELAG